MGFDGLKNASQNFKEALISCNTNSIIGSHNIFSLVKKSQRSKVGVIPKSRSEELHRGMKKWVDSAFYPAISSGWIKPMSPQRLQFDVGYGRAERTGSNGGANEVLGVGASNLDKMISTVVFFLKRLQNREQGKKFTSKQLESECSKKAFSFLNKVLQQVEAHTEESAKLLVITDKSNRSTKGLLEKHVPDIDWEWSWCFYILQAMVLWHIWHM